MELLICLFVVAVIIRSAISKQHRGRWRGSRYTARGRLSPYV